MVFSWIVIFALCVCSTQALNLNYPNGATTQVTCDKGETQSYQRIGEKYYFLGEKMSTWFESAHLCRQFGGDLALIESAKEMDAISTFLKNRRYENIRIWTSGNDLVEIHKFASLTNGLPLSFTSWSVGQPDNPGIERCVHLWFKDGAFRMNNWDCPGKAFYLCQRQNYTRCWDGY
ncbi:C-type lectin 37Db-like [Drosophila innubila]|uniref:C-type lectin 37Db-like n=1 Tax=Drosophila innubila TaxID=198719 RepID=UPI00148DCCEC|nr:C-type lectin 37Db-like [Drosophila innubila]